MKAFWIGPSSPFQCKSNWFQQPYFYYQQNPVKIEFDCVCVSPGCAVHLGGVQLLVEGRLRYVETSQFRIECIDVQIVQIDSSSGGSGLRANLLRLAHETEHVTQHGTLNFFCIHNMFEKQKQLIINNE